MEEIADLLDLTPALVLGTCSFYTMFKREPVGKLLVSVCTNVSCLVNGGPDLLEHLAAALRGRQRRDRRRGRVHRRLRPRARPAGELRVPRAAHRPRPPRALIDEYKAGRRVARTISGSPVREREAAGRVSGPPRASHRDGAATVVAETRIITKFLQRAPRRLVDHRRRARQRRVRRAAQGARHGARGHRRRGHRRRASAVAAAPASAPARSGRSCRRTCSRATSR